MFERLDDRALLAMALMARSIAAEGRGDVDAEAAYSDRAERIFRELGNTSALDAVLSNRGYAEIIAGNFESAERRLRELAESATGPSRLFATANHALALARLGRLDEAEERFASVLQSAVDERSTEIMFYGFEGLAVVAGSRAEDVRAAQLWGVAAGITEATRLRARNGRTGLPRRARARGARASRRSWRSTRRGASAGSAHSTRRSRSRYAGRSSTDPSRCANATSSFTAFSTSSSETSSVGVWM